MRRRIGSAAVAAAVVVVAVAAAETLTPTVSPELATDAPLVGPATGEQLAPAVASGGGVTLIAWMDRRADASHYDIVAARIGADGALLEPRELAVGVGPTSGGSPAVAWGGDAFLVVWDEESGGGREIRARRVAADGSLLGDTLVVAGGSGWRSRPAVAWAGGSWLVVWEDTGTSGWYEVRGRRVGADGAVAGGTIAITAGGGNRRAPAVAGGAEFLVVWESCPDYCAVWGARIGVDGVVKDLAGIPISPAAVAQSAPAVASDGTDYLVVWQDYDQMTYTADVRGARVSAAGVVLDAAGFDVAAPAGDQIQPTVVAGGGGYLVAWQDWRGVGPTSPNPDVYAARVGADGVVVEPDGVEVAPTYQTSARPSAAWDGVGWVIATWPFSQSTGYDVVATRLAADLAPREPTGFPIATSANSQDVPAVARGAEAWLVVWRDSRDGAPALYAVRVGDDGTVLDEPALAVATGAPGAGAPSVAWGGGDWLVVWDDARAGGSDIYAARVAADGTVRDPGGIVVSSVPIAQVAPRAAWGQDSWLIVWLDNRSGAFAWYVYGARLAPDGTLLDPLAIGITFATPSQHGPAVAWAAGRWLVVWEDDRRFERDLFGARVTGDGEVLDDEGFPVAMVDSTQEAPALAAFGDEVLVVWQDWRTGDAEIYGARVGSGGVRDPGGIRITATAGHQTAPAVAHDGYHFLVTWSDAPDGTGVDLAATWVTLGGRVIDPVGVVVSAETGDERGAVVASDGRGASLVAYQRYDGGEPFRASRVRARLVTDGPTSGVEVPEEGDGCGCRAAPRTGSRGGLLVMLLVGIALIRTAAARRGRSGR